MMISDRNRKTEHWEDIAIVGMSGVFPGAANLEEFHQNLKNGKECTGDIPKPRRAAANLSLDQEYVPGGYLDRVDLFDHQFFGLSLREAELMDPQQRVMLQLVCGAIENAGYSLESLVGSRTAVIVGCKYSDYSFLLPKKSLGTAMVGNLPAMASGRISYLLDLHGPSMNVDTLCSTSLYGVYLASRTLINNEATAAIVSSAQISNRFLLKGDQSGDIGIISKDGKCRAFDKRASGTLGGEGGGALLLKKLGDALEDGDHVHAVIKGGAVNHDGRRSSGLTVPSHEAQTEVIRKAWENGYRGHSPIAQP